MYFSFLSRNDQISISILDSDTNCTLDSTFSRLDLTGLSNYNAAGVQEITNVVRLQCDAVINMIKLDGNSMEINITNMRTNSSQQHTIDTVRSESK